MAVPKRKMSKRKVRSRKAALTTQVVATKPCPECGSDQQSHRVCPSCGYYRGRQVITIEAK